MASLRWFMIHCAVAFDIGILQDAGELCSGEKSSVGVDDWSDRGGREVHVSTTSFHDLLRSGFRMPRAYYSGVVLQHTAAQFDKDAVLGKVPLRYNRAALANSNSDIDQATLNDKLARLTERLYSPKLIVNLGLQSSMQLV
ncbi:uncharacterized protein F5147DRAFT_650827 [Suillus discolor]|uniref:Uncharacterized protein n=1 Tax=Suillus discolor TaxID=1912936 RepID=A0A9P7FAW7_9AGAM|nr:uncharacterized protein F5147DRAFT_650827 [Suillus discolor]KAG2112677.1 hypothetical protein F5147DRAFT_650827 [Suillus discolor]